MITDGDGCTQRMDIILPEPMDLTPPVAICRDMTVALDETGLATVMASDLDDGSLDDCAGIILSDEEIIVDCEDAYKQLQTGQTKTITLHVEDMSGNTDYCTGELSVIFLPGDDDDCDGISNACDVIRGGDDFIDVNGDGTPDCSQVLKEYTPEWYGPKSTQ